MPEDKELGDKGFLGFFFWLLFFFNDKMPCRAPTESKDKGGVLKAQTLTHATPDMTRRLMYDKVY